MLLMSSSRLSRWVARGRWLVLVSLAGCVVSYQIGGTGILSAVALCLFGASAASVEKFDHEPGLWMFASLILVVAACMWILFTLSSVLPSTNGFPGIATLVDAAVATVLFGLLIRCMASVIAHNHSLAPSESKDE